MSDLAIPIPAMPPATGRRRVTRLVLGSWDGRVGLGTAVVLVLVALCALLHLLPFSPTAQHPSDALIGPSWTYWAGTDQFGRDVFSRTLAGAAASLEIAVLGVLIAAVAGTAAGTLAGFARGWIGSAVLRVTDVLFAFPSILLALVVVTALGRGWLDSAIAIAVVYTPQFVRVALGPVLALRHADFVEAGRVLGLPTRRLLTVHILPNILPIVLVQLTLSLSTAILVESSLSFLGLGTQPPQASLGLMVNDARVFASFAPWTMAAPAVALVIAVLAFNLVGDALRDALDLQGT